MVALLRSRRTPALMALDAAALLAAYVLIALLRHPETPGPDGALGDVLAIALVAVLVQWAIGTSLHLYRGRTAVASLDETVSLGVATLGGGALLAVSAAVSTPHFVARSVPIAATSLALSLMLMARAVWRRLQQRAEAPPPDEHARPALVFGAGEAGRQLVASMRHAPGSPLYPVALLDDDPWKRRRRLDGVPVLGTREEIARVAAETRAEVLVIAVPSAGPELVGEVSQAASEAGLAVKVLPGLSELLSGRVGVHDVRDIDVHDVLGRRPVRTDLAGLGGYLVGRRVLVTGAGGSIGAELCRQIQHWNPSELIMLDRDESALHAVQLSMTGRALLDTADVVLSDIRDERGLCDIFRARRPQVVFHAAALKHLPMLEQYPHEAWKTNVVGTANLLQTATAEGVERFVNISTDKAADPRSVLGYSKRVAERLTAEAARATGGCYLSVRFGNVLGSRGSVLTAFAAQVATGGPVTVTHPDVTRYFMTAEEAVDLVIQAAAIGQGGQALILDMGAPVRIEDVARQLIRRSGRRIDIVYTGLRDGEKLHEQLVGRNEVGERLVHPDVSHVSVPPLALAQVRGAGWPLTADELRVRLRSWCDQPGSTALAGDAGDRGRLPS